MTKSFKLKLPIPINFITVDIGTSIRDITSIAIEDLSEEEALLYAEELKQDFLRHYREKVKQPTIIKR